MAIIFEIDDPDGIPNSGDEVRQDRIVFFCTGNFRSLSGYMDSTARVFYGQAEDEFPVHTDLESALPRRILCRRTKIIAFDGNTADPCDLVTPDRTTTDPEVYDYEEAES